MILVDANLLIYAVNADAAQHRAARGWLEQVLSSTTSVGLAWIVILAFVRITTHPKVFKRPLGAEQALAYIDAWLQQPYVVPVSPGEKHWMVLKNILQHCGTAGNLSSDAHLAAIAIEKGYHLFSADNDFKRFKGLQHSNPLEAYEVHEPLASYE